jgi:hypothetical protein
MAVAVGANLVPDLVHSPPTGGLWLKEWYTRYLVPMGNEGHIPGIWATAWENNQSLAGAVGRIFVTSLNRTAEGVRIMAQESVWMPSTLKKITTVLQAMVTFPAAYALWRRRRSGGPRREAPAADVLEISLVLLLMLLLSPNSSPAHFGLMLLPAFCMARIAVVERNRVAWALISAATIATLVSHNTPGLRGLYLVTLWSGAVTLAAVLLLAGCVIGLLSRPDSQSS